MRWYGLIPRPYAWVICTLYKEKYRTCAQGQSWGTKLSAR